MRVVVVTISTRVSVQHNNSSGRSHATAAINCVLPFVFSILSTGKSSVDPMFLCRPFMTTPRPTVLGQGPTAVSLTSLAVR